MPPSGDPTRRPLLIVVTLLIAALGVGGAVVFINLRAAPQQAAAKPTGGAGRVRGPEAIETALHAAQIYVNEKKYAEAVKILDTLAAQAPTDRAVRVAYAQALLGQEKHADAYQQYEAAIALSPTPGLKMADPSSAAHAQRDPALAQLHFEAGTCASVAGKPDRATEHYWMAQVLDPAEARYPLYLAMVQIKTGDDAAAAASLIRAVKINPDLAEGWGTLAELELKQNRLTLAAQHIEQARTLQPNLTRWRLCQARVLNRQGDAEKADALLAALPTAERVQTPVLTLRAESLGLLHKPAAAAAMYAEAAQALPADPDLAFQAAVWFNRAGEKPKAAQWAKRAGMLGHQGAKELAAELGS